MKRKLEISELIFKIISYTLLTVFAVLVSQAKPFKASIKSFYREHSKQVLSVIHR